MAGTVNQDATTEPVFFHYERASPRGNGNVTELTDKDAERVATYRYEVFGKVRQQAGPAAEQNTYRFSTKSEERTTGFSYYGYRFYNSQAGRWIVGEIPASKEWNLYSFVNNRPLDAFDLHGMISSLAGSSPAAAAAAASGASATQLATEFGIPLAAAYKLIRCHKLGLKKRNAINAAEDLGGCSGSMSCDELRSRSRAWKRNASARWNYDLECHLGGDAGHNTVQQAAYKAYLKCKKLLKKNGCCN